jgi:hypothetical protein
MVSGQKRVREAIADLNCVGVELDCTKGQSIEPRPR